MQWCSVKSKRIYLISYLVQSSYKMNSLSCSIWLLQIGIMQQQTIQRYESRTYLQRMERGVVETERVWVRVHVLGGLSLETHHELLGSLPLCFTLLGCLASGTYNLGRILFLFFFNKKNKNREDVLQFSCQIKSNLSCICCDLV